MKEIANLILTSGSYPSGTDHPKQWLMDKLGAIAETPEGQQIGLQIGWLQNTQIRTWKDITRELGIPQPPSQSAIITLTRAMQRASAGKSVNLISNQTPNQITPNTMVTNQEPIVSVSEPSNHNANNAADLLRAAMQSLMPKVEIDRQQVIDLIQENAVSEERLIDLIQNHSPIKTIKVEIGGQSKVLDGQVFHKKFEQSLKFAMAGFNLWLYGPAGTGKTYMAEQIAEAMGRESVVQPVCNQTPISFFEGYNNAHGDYIETELYRAFTQGKIYIIDEVDNGNPNSLTFLNTCIQSQNVCFAGRIFKRHPNFQVIACGNTFGSGATEQYIGRNGQDLSFTNRFEKVLIENDKHLEKSLYGIEACEMVWSARQILEGKTGWVLTQRNISRIQKMFAMGMSKQECWEQAILGQISPNLRSLLPTYI